MRFIKHLGFCVLVSASGAVLAERVAPGDEAFPDSLFTFIEPFAGEEVTGEWYQDASAKELFQVYGKVNGDRLVIRSDKATRGDAGMLKRKIEADSYRDKRMMLEVEYKPTDVSESVVIYFAAKDEQDDQARYMAYDSTYYEPIRGTGEWQTRQMVLQIPAGADYLSYGVGLVGSGVVEIGDVSIREVDASTPVTDKEYIGRLFDSRKFEEFLVEQGKIDFGDKIAPRFARLTLDRYMALKELDRDARAEKVIGGLLELVQGGDWQQSNDSITGDILTLDVLYHAGRLTAEEYLASIQELEFPSEDERKAVIKGTYGNIGFQERVNGNYPAARNAYAKAASREWGKDLDYSVVDRYLKEMKQAVLAMDD
ncbi:hypothetical protein [Microbulbifer yueqingensis]|uniref:Uncharacterized protein n=1 Tax=Microbulbifer yueqingensis TaxID=658219 RepID=A0A1G8VWB2_9GAMM|nr:hypothetical protein [Microbulbifer yueqingensis]SDJ70289.1 hypothetical protein SAMN05216212_0761 [Microbulbifer yueqingensis]